MSLKQQVSSVKVVWGSAKQLQMHITSQLSQFLIETQTNTLRMNKYTPQ